MTYADQVREIAARLKRFTAADLIGEVVPSGPTFKSAVRTAVRDFLRRGELARVAKGQLEYRALPARPRAKAEIVWHLVRSHKAFTTDEIERLSGAKRDTALEYLQCLAKLGFLRKTGLSSWQLIADPGPAVPVNFKKCERLREHRQAVKRNHVARSEA